MEEIDVGGGSVALSPDHSDGPDTKMQKQLETERPAYELYKDDLTPKRNTEDYQRLKKELDGLGMDYRTDGPIFHNSGNDRECIKVLRSETFSRFAREEANFPSHCFYDPEKPHFVYPYVSVQGYGNINILDKEFDINLFIRVAWKPSSREVESFLNTRGTTIDEGLIEYRPSMIVVNAIDERSIQEWSQPDLFFTPSGQFFLLTMTKTSIFKCTEVFELQNFPVDCQDLTVILSPEKGDFKIVGVQNVVWLPPNNEGLTSTMVSSLIDEYKYHGFFVEFMEKRYAIENTSVSCLILRVKLQRNYQHYLYRLCLVLSLVSLTGSVGFTIDLEDDFPDACAYMSTCLLTVVAFMFVITSTLPPIPYLTLLDKFVYTLLVFVTSQTFLIVITRFFEDLASQWEILFWISVAGWATIHIFFLIYATRKFKVEMSKLSMNGCELRKYFQQPNETQNILFDASNLPLADYWYGGEKF